MAAYPPYPEQVSFFRRVVDALVSLVLSLGALAAIVVVVGGYALSGPKHHGPKGGNFDGHRFVNVPETDHGGWWALGKWLATRKPPQWQKREVVFGPKPPARVGKGELRVTFVNHATVLIQQDGLNILTDPTWSDRASPVSWAGPQRFHSPGITKEDLPPIDVVAISHNHYDHLDLPTLKWLHAARKPTFYVGLGNRPLLTEAGITQVKEMDWWQSVEIGQSGGEPVELIGVPARHFSGRGLFDRDRTLWLGFVVRGPAGSTYFAGDTGFGTHFAEIKRRFGSPRLALLPIGASLPAWFMKEVHLNPAEAVDAHEVLGAGMSVPLHYGTFPLGDDGQDQPLRGLEETLAKKPASGPGWSVLKFGEGRMVPALPAAEKPARTTAAVDGKLAAQPGATPETKAP